MYSLRKFSTRSGNIGQALPEAYPSWSAERVVFRRGGTSLIAGQPGTYKSVLALNLLSRWANAGLRGMYFSADSDEFTVAHRLGAIITGRADELVEQEMSRKPSLQDYQLASLDGFAFVYRSLDMEGIAAHVAAFEALHGEYPDVIFVDNLINFAESATDWGEMIELEKQLDGLAREVKAHIVILHHVTDGWPSGVPVPRSAIQGKVTQIPRLVLTIAATGRCLQMACVKNTNGPQYPNAEKTMDFMVRESLRVEDVEYA